MLFPRFNNKIVSIVIFCLDLLFGSHFGIAQNVKNFMVPSPNKAIELNVAIGENLSCRFLLLV